MRKTGRNAAADNQRKQSSGRPGCRFFMGSGSTVKAALALGRRAIGVELETGRFEQTVREVQDLIV